MEVRAHEMVVHQDDSDGEDRTDVLFEVADILFSAASAVEDAAVSSLLSVLHSNTLYTNIYLTSYKKCRGL